MPTHRLHDHDGDDLGLLEHPAPNVEPGDVVVLADGRDALVAARVESRPGYPIQALLEVVAGESSDGHRIRPDTVSRYVYRDDAPGRAMLPAMPRWLVLVALSASVVAGCAGASNGSVAAEDLPAALRQADHLLGAVDQAMDRCPDAPADSLQIPPSIIKRIQEDSYFDPKVRSWVQGTIRAQEKLNTCRRPAFADAIPQAEKARQLAHELERTDDISLDFIDALGSVTGRTQERVMAEGAAGAQTEVAIATFRATLEAFAKFKRDGELGAFVNMTDAEFELALQERLSPYVDALQGAAAEAFALRTRSEDAVSALNRAEQLLDELVQRDEDAGRVASALAAADPEGYFGQGPAIRP